MVIYLILKSIFLFSFIGIIVLSDYHERYFLKLLVFNKRLVGEDYI